ncbi:MAG: TetR/AcrR family transcriptional regulator [Thermoplasmata archaeon]|nr:TetR/AcrR family transcriptional regulator [Thermoplasmata archaeon]
MVESAASLIGSRGIAATSLSEVLEASGAPRGSVYHHFPEGKRELAGEAMRWTQEQVLAYQRGCRSTTASGVLDHFVDLFRQSMVSSKCRAGCPVAGVLVDTYSQEDGLMRIGRESFRAWISLLTDQLRGAGISPRASRSLAITTLASVEGALILCRAEGGVEPLDRVNAELRALAAVYPRGRGPSPRRA